MATLIKMLAKLLNKRTAYDDTITDRLSHVITSSALVLFSVLITSKQYVGEAIQCWVPKEFNGNQGNYADDYCWVHGTYYVPFDEENIPSVEGEGRRPNINYYQWVPLLLLVQALMYGAAHKVWGSMYLACGLDLANLVKSGKRINSLQMKNDLKQQILSDMATQIERYLRSNNLKKFIYLHNTLSLKHIFALTCFRRCSAKNLNYLATLLIFVKTLYALNAIFQFFFLSFLLQTNFWFYGIAAMRAFMDGGMPFHSWPFPKVTLCDFKIRRLGNLHNYTVQCALPINLFNEKLFILLWLLMLLVVVMSLISLAKWTLWMISRRDRYKFVRSLLLLTRAITVKKESSDDNEVDGEFERRQRMQLVWFAERHLRSDGVLILHLLSQATNRITAMEVAEQLWNNFKAKINE